MASEFIKLIKINKAENQDDVKKSEKSSNKKTPKFKKGSWKYWLYKKLKKAPIGKHVDKFHETTMDNLVVYNDGKPKITISNQKLSKKTIDKLTEKYPDSYILINSSENMFTKISLNSYKKFIGVEKIMIYFEMEVHDDGEKPYTVVETETAIDSINKLFYFLNYERVRIDSIYDLQARITWYTTYEFKYRVMVSRKDGTTEYYKGNLNKFLKAYELRII